MSGALHRRLIDQLDRTCIPLILEDSLNHQALVRLCHACSLTYDGTRTQSISTRKLIADLAEEFYKNDEHARTITKALIKANEKIIKKFQRMSPHQLEALHGDDLTPLASEGKFGSFLFAIAADERNEVSTLFDRLTHHVATLNQGLTDVETSDLLVSPTEETLSPPPISLDKVGKLLKEITRLSTHLQEMEEQREELERKITQFVTERKAMKDRIAELQREAGNLQRINTSLEEENGKLKKQIENIAEEHKNSVPHSLMNQLIRDQKKICYQIERLVQAEHLIKKEDGPGRFVEAIGETIAEIKEIMRQDMDTSAIEWIGAKKMLEDLRSDMLFLHADVKRLQETTNSKRHFRHANDLDRVGVFVDVQNIFYAAKQFNARLDFEKLLKTSVGNRRLIRALAYVVQSPEVDQSGFITMLQQKNYEVKRKNLRLRSDGSAKGDWDMGMAIDMISLADRLDIVVLVSGDGDFVSLVNLIKTMGPRVEVFSFLHNTAKDLIQAADYHYSIEEELLLKLNNSEITERCSSSIT